MWRVSHPKTILPLFADKKISNSSHGHGDHKFWIITNCRTGVIWKTLVPPVLFWGQRRHKFACDERNPRKALVQIICPYAGPVLFIELREGQPKLPRRSKLTYEPSGSVAANRSLFFENRKKEYRTQGNRKDWYIIYEIKCITPKRWGIYGKFLKLKEVYRKLGNRAFVHIHKQFKIAGQLYTNAQGF